MAAFDEIRRFLSAVRSRLSRIRAVEGLAITSLVLMSLAAATVLGASLADAASIELLRWAAAALTTAVIVGALARYVFLPWQRFRRDAAVARHIQSSLEVGTGVLSCVELEEQLEEIGRSGRFDVGLIQAQANATARQLRSVQPADIVTWQRSVRLGQALGMVAIGLLASVLAFPEPFSDGASALVRGAMAPETRPVLDGRERDVVIGDITYYLTYPAYTRRATRVLRNTSGDVTALTGTRIKLQTRSLEAAEQAYLMFEGERPPLALAIAESGALTGELTVTETVTWWVEIVGPDGTRVRERERRIIEAEADQPPEIELLQPTEDIELERLDKVKLHYNTADDFGLAGVDVVTELTGSGEPPVRRRVETLDGARNHVGETAVDPGAAGMLPGDTITAWLEASDTNTISEHPGVAHSRKIRIKLHSPEERHNEMIEAERKLVDLMIDLLADRLESPIETQRIDRFERLMDTQTGISRSNSMMLDIFVAVVAALKVDPLAEDGHKADLATLLEQHQALQKREVHLLQAALGEARSAERVQHLAVLLRANASAVEQLEHDIIMLDRIIDQQHQQRLVEQARAIRERQRKMMDLLEQMKTNKDPALEMQLMQQMDRLMRQIERLRRDMRSNTKPTPYENMNVDAFEPSEQIKDLGEMETAIDKMKRLIQEGKLDEAMELAESLANDVQELTSALESDLQNMARSADGQRTEKMRRTVKDLEKIQAREDSISRETQKFAEQTERRMSELVREKLVPGIAEQMSNINELMRRLNKVAPDDLDPRDKKKLEGVAQQMSDLRETLSQEDLGQAAKIAGEIQEQLQELSDDVQLGAEKMKDRQGNTPMVNRAKRNGRRLKSAMPKAKEIARKLKAMMPTPDDLLDRGSRRKMDRLGERQKRNQERLQRMRQRAQQLDEEAPGLGAELSEKLDEAEQAMERAEQSLRSHRPNKAGEHEKEAMDKLTEARKSVEQRMAPPGKRRAGDGPGLDGKDDVAIPDEERYAVPKEFRERLLEGMGHRAPGRYKSLIQRYYEALVQ